MRFYIRIDDCAGKQKSSCVLCACFTLVSLCQYVSQFCPLIRCYTLRLPAIVKILSGLRCAVFLSLSIVSFQLCSRYATLNRIDVTPNEFLNFPKHSCFCYSVVSMFQVEKKSDTGARKGTALSSRCILSFSQNDSLRFIDDFVWVWKNECACVW